MKLFCDYFQFTAMTIFLIIFIGRTLQMRLTKNVKPFRLGIAKKGFQGLVEISFFVILPVWIIEVYLSALHTNFRLLPVFFQIVLVDNWLAKFIGALLVVIGLIVFIGALLSFRESWRIGIDKDAGGDLITTGLFRFSRNPIFLFIDLFFLGIFLINGTIEYLSFYLVVAAGLHYQILQEEKFLIETYGQPYRDYCRRTARYLGWGGAGQHNR